MNCERVTSENSQIAQNVAEGLLKKVSSQLSIPFTPKLVGSKNHNTVIKDTNGMYDLDYQILLGNAVTDSPSDIKNAFCRAFENIKQPEDKVEDSTSAITVKCKNNSSNYLFSIDFVIVNNTGSSIIRRNGPNEYTWNQLPTRNSDAYAKFDRLSGTEKSSLIDKIIKRKCAAKRNRTGESSYHIFIEEVNNHRS
ncbi:MAG: hypothetical protein LBE57_01875 [Methanosarcinales archaeon]|jgi:hypothetical protein|nr:hypothetical protein [Methanosarcinales archaeon]